MQISHPKLAKQPYRYAMQYAYLPYICSFISSKLL